MLYGAAVITYIKANTLPNIQPLLVIMRIVKMIGK